MPNNDWYEYSSEEMQHLGEMPGDILGLVMHDYEPENDNERSRETRSPEVQESKPAMPARDKLMMQAPHTYRDWQAMLVLHVWQPPPTGLQRIRKVNSFTNRRETT